MKNFPNPFWSSPGAALYLGDALACLRAMPTRSVHCVVTSPPYWGLRDYGTGNAQIGLEERADCLGWATAQPCGECYVCHLVYVFNEVRRVLRDDGTCWLNLGDTFNDSGQSMIPAAMAMALRADGWTLRQDIIWHAPNKMPESVQNRCSKSHEHIFLLTKGTGYYFDSLAIAEEGKSKPHSPGNVKIKEDAGRQLLRNDCQNMCSKEKVRASDGIVNKRDVWIVPTQGYPGAHFATFSPRLIEPCILAGTSDHGACSACGMPWRRVVVKTEGKSVLTGGAYNPPGQSPHGNARCDSRDRSFKWSRNGKPDSGSTLDGNIARRETVGWQRGCGCNTTSVVPCVVLDPFVGSGTTVATSILLGRHGIGIDLSETYLSDHAIPRIEAALRGEKSVRKPTIVMPVDVPPAPRRLRGQ